MENLMTFEKHKDKRINEMHERFLEYTRIKKKENRWAKQS